MKFRNKKVGLSLLASVILLSSMLGYQYALSSVPASGPYYLDVPFGTASYYVGKFDNGSTYMVKGDTWQCTWWSTNDSAVINAALGNLTSGRTWQETVFLKGNYTIDSTILPSAYTLLELDGNVTLADGANCDLVRNKNWGVGDDYITIRGGLWRGNKNEQTSGNGFNFSYTNYLRLQNVDVDDIKETSFYLASSGSARVYDCDFDGADGHSIHWYTVSDSEIERCFAGNSVKCGFLYEYGSSILMSDMYFGGACTEYAGQVYLYGWKNSFMNNIVIDSSGRDGLVLAGASEEHASHNDLFNNVRVSRPLVAGYDAVKLQGYTQNNTFNNFYIGQKGEADDSAVGWRCGINETGNSDWNLFNNVISRNCTTYYSLVGTSSKITNADPKTENSGTATNVVNGTWVTHSLAGTPDVVTLTISGSNYINSTCYLLAPTVIASNSTMFQIGFYINNAGTITAVSATDQRDIYWEAIYKP